MSQVSYGTITIVDTTDIERIYMVYAKSVSNTIPPSDELTWSESIASAPGEGDFIWQKTVVEKAITEEKTYSDPVCVTGSSGQGVEKIINYYCNYGQGQPEEDYSGWQLEIPEYDSNKPNYWTKVVVIYSDDTREDFQASGTIATFENEKVGVLDSLEVTLSLIQDLHGYDHPWVGGASSNKWDEQWELGSIYMGTGGDSITSGYYRSKYFTIQPNTTYYMKSPVQMLFFFYDANKTYLGDEYRVIVKDGTFTTPSGTTYARFRNNVQNAWTPYNNDIAINYPSTVTTYSPYSNICPISGWDSVDVSVCGKNLIPFPYDGSTVSQSGITVTANSDGSFVLNGTATATVYLWLVDKTNNIPSWVKPNTTYTVSCGNGQFNNAPRVQMILYGSPTFAITESTKTTPSDLSVYTQFAVVVQIANGSTYTNKTIYPQIECGSSATAFEPHTSDTYQTTLPQTVYGGTLDVVSGVLTVDRAMVDLGSLTWTYQANYQRFTTSDIYQDVAKPPNNNTQTGAISSVYVESTSNRTANPNYDKTFGISDGGSVQIRDEAYTDATALQTSLIGQTMVYFLATPTTIQLTPQQIDSLLGRNNVWSDGAVEVEGHTISKKDIMIYKDNGLTDVANKSAEANTNAAEALEKANDGIISTTQLWYQTNSTSALNVPSNHSQVDQGTITYNNWRSVRPNNSVDSYKYYYYCYEYLHGDGTYTYSAEAVLDTSNLSQYQIDQLQVRIKKIWSNSTGSYMASGVKVGTETREVDINDSSTYGFNSKSTTTGVSFNYNTIPLTSLGTDGIKLYSPTLTNGVITGSRLDATLNTNGLFLNRGGIESGGLSSGNGYVYLSTLDKAGITINGYTPGTNDPKWRAVIGSKFGVDSEGNLYANNANISGKITANSGSNVYTTTETDEIIGDVYDKASETKIIKYAYSTTLSSDDLSLTNTELPYRGIYVGPVDETAFEDFDNYTWELNPVWASKYADQYLHSIEDGIAIYNSDLGSDTYAGLSATALTFFLANIEQMRVGYEASIDDYGVIASSLIALGSGAGIKFDNYGHTDEGARGRYVWEVRDNGHLSLKLF